MTYTSFYERADFDREVTRIEAQQHRAHIAANDAFVLAMARAVTRGKEKAAPGTFVDNSPRVFRVIRGEVLMSSCGSPAAMCTEAGGAPSGAQTLR